MKSNKQRLTWYRFEWRDSQHKDKWTACTVSVFAPTYELPFVSVLISIANGGGRVLMRCANLEEAKSRVVIPEEGWERLELALTKAQGILEVIQRDLRILSGLQTMAPGSSLVRTDTGEVVAEVEKLLREAHGYTD